MLLSTSLAFSQKSIVVCADSIPHALLAKKNGLHKNAKDTIDLQTQLKQFVTFAQSQGYLAFSIDSVTENASSFYIYPFIGKYYHSASLLLSDDDALFIENTPLQKWVNDHLIRLTDYSAFTSQTLDYLENSGYPFAQISLINPDFQQDTISIVSIEKNRLITFDSVILKGNVKIKNSFMFPYLGLRKNKPYREKIFRQVPRRLNDLTFASVIRPAGVEFVGDKAYLYLFLEKQKVNQFDGYLGIVPVSSQNGKVMITGEVNLSLQNIFHIGEKLQLSWKCPETYSQFLNVSADFPYLFRTPFGVAAAFMLDKKDTNYLNMNYKVALQYSFGGNNNLRTYFDYTSSSLLSPQSITITPTDSLSFDFHKTMYGIRFSYRLLDNIRYPQRGIVVCGDFSVGSRAVEKNQEIADALYQNIDLMVVNYQLEGELAGFVPLHKRWVWVVGSRGGWKGGTQQLSNDLFKIGGTQSLQGFDEMSLRASAYLIGYTEIRFRFARLSYLNLFVNGAWYERVVAQAPYFNDFPWGFGLGANFDTKAGLFYISYALGQQQNSPISFKTGKIHFGLAVHF